jgi:hypothetical protein
MQSFSYARSGVSAKVTMRDGTVTKPPQPDYVRMYGATYFSQDIKEQMLELFRLGEETNTDRMSAATMLEDQSEVPPTS